MIRWIRGLVIHVRAGYSPFTYNNRDCGCIFSVPR